MTGQGQPAHLLEQVPAAVVAVDAAGRVTSWNSGAQELYGWTATQAIGCRVRDLFLRGQVYDDVLAGLREHGTWQGEMTVLHRDGSAVLVHVRNAVLRDGRGVQVGIVGVALDAGALRGLDRRDLVAGLTARTVAAAARTERLQQLTAALVPVRTSQEVADVVAAYGVEAVGAAAGSVLLVPVLGDDDRGLVLAAHQGHGADVVAPYGRLPGDSPLPAAEAVRTGRPQLYPDRAAWEQAFPDLPRSQRFDARATVPLSSGGRPLGALALSFPGPRRFDDDDVAFLVTLGRQAGQAVERARLLEAERESARRSAYLARASQRLTRSLDLAPTLRELTALLVPDLADLAVVHVLEDERLVGRACAHRDPARDRELAEAVLGHELDLGGAGGAAVAARTGRGQRYAGDPTGGRGCVPGHRSGLAVPVLAGGRVIAVIDLTREQGPAYAPRDLAVTEELARWASVALSHARDYERERERALTLQRSLLPRSQPDLAGMTFDWRYLPGAEGSLVGGDWYDVLPVEHGRVALVIGDVMGSGVHAAAVMGQLRATAQAYTEAGMRPGELLTRLDRALARLDAETTTTLLYVVVDPATRGATLACAGHLPPLVCAPGTSPHFVELEPGPPLGTGAEAYAETRLQLPPAATLLLYTDGLVEDRHQPVGLGMQRLQDSVEQAGCHGAREVCDAALAGTRRRRGRADDTALLAAQLVESDLAPFVHRVLAHPAELGALRDLVRRRTRLWQLPADLDDDLLVVLTELAGNALLHAGGSVEATVRLEPDLVRVEVRDGEPRSLPLPSLDALTRSAGRAHDDELDAVIDALAGSGTTGRGMALVEQLCTRSGTVVDAAGKVVWAELALVRVPAAVLPGPRPAGEARPLRPLRLLSLPVRLVLGSAVALDELLREVVVSATTDPLRALGLEAAALGRETAQSREPFRLAARDALARGQRLVDVQAQASERLAPALARMQQVLDELVALARAGVLLASVPDPEVEAFRRWWAAEIARQVAGAPPQPCPFPALPPA